ncbi:MULTISPECIES: HemK2/MTQ2 family protein methyltransferase [Mycolicibacterium]|uniref:HemK-related putative methylase n=1 Tax=Mycolicibacterium gilvum (strain DSM 45189 / LMG 24558 / Spyr1) TaxID=278137 RepID=E6TNJ9_MYCSR|nr:MULTISPECIES: HemK2/MTQ2 family protein methyltransferase [Mycolicibacterium]ADU01676.1 HemK-related putative methylase [Mycolicibacterium gilvum Spyr1]MBV5242221.1 class I SAM-dependent methyltransferase [Mycolicibacterium sp. PAM1]
MTSAYTEFDARDLAVDVYPPQEDSHLLIDAMIEAGVVPGARVADLCTGSGVIAIAAAAAGAASVTAFDICPKAVQRTREEALAAGVEVDVHRGSWARAVEFRPFDVVLANPPYVPEAPMDDSGLISATAGPSRAWDAGPDGRVVLDPMCAAAPLLLAEGGTMLVVHSECSSVTRTLRAFRAQGMKAEVVAQQLIPFGPVMTARAPWLRRAGLLGPNSTQERIVVVRADAP